MIEGNILEIALVAAVAVFAVTCFFVIRTLIAIDRAIAPLQKKVEHLCDEGCRVLRTTDNRLESLNSVFRSISNLGDIGESKTQKLKSYLLEGQPPVREEPLLGEELAQWALSTVSIYRKFLKKGS